MRIALLLAALLTSYAAHAGLYDDFSRADDARDEAIAQQNNASRMAYQQSVTAAWLLKNLGLPDGTSVVDEGETHEGIGEGEQYNVGGVWGCEVFIPNGMGLGVSCLNSSGQRHNFSAGPIDHSDEQWECIHYPQYASHCGTKAPAKKLKKKTRR